MTPEPVPSEERWNIRRTATGIAVTGPDTDWIEVIPRSTLSDLADELEARAEKSKEIGNLSGGDEQIETLRAGEFYAYQDAAALIRSRMGEER